MVDEQIASFLLDTGPQQIIEKKEILKVTEEPVKIIIKELVKPKIEKPKEEFGSIQPEGGRKMNPPIKLGSEAVKPPLIEKKKAIEVKKTPVVPIVK